jgi:hypothetical protein
MQILKVSKVFTTTPVWICTSSLGFATKTLKPLSLQLSAFFPSLFKSTMVCRLSVSQAGRTLPMLDAQKAARKMAAAFYELTLARASSDASINRADKFKAAHRRVTVLARIFLPLRNSAEFKAAYAREVAALRRQTASASDASNAGSAQQARLSLSPR